jgi:ATP-binding cassette subfamily B (MDR/TAP) protein 1
MTTDHEPITEKPSASSSNPQDQSTQKTKEDKLETKVKIRPERTANFKDYLVSNIVLISSHLRTAALTLDN